MPSAHRRRCMAARALQSATPSSYLPARTRGRRLVRSRRRLLFRSRPTDGGSSPNAAGVDRNTAERNGGAPPGPRRSPRVQGERRRRSRGGGGFQAVRASDRQDRWSDRFDRRISGRVFLAASARPSRHAEPPFSCAPISVARSVGSRPRECLSGAAAVCNEGRIPCCKPGAGVIARAGDLTARSGMRGRNGDGVLWQSGSPRPF